MPLSELRVRVYVYVFTANVGVGMVANKNSFKNTTATAPIVSQGYRMVPLVAKTIGEQF